MKRLAVALTALVFALTAVLINPISSSAVGVDTVVKLTGGKMVVRGLAEKAGLALSPKQLDNVVDLVERKTYDGDTEVIEWVNKANALPSNPSATPSSKTGFKKYVADPVLWLTGLDLIVEAIDAFEDGYNDSTPVPLYKHKAPDGMVYDPNGSKPYVLEFWRDNVAPKYVLYSNPNMTFVDDSNGVKLYAPGSFQIWEKHVTTGLYTKTNDLTNNSTTSPTSIVSSTDSTYSLGKTKKTTFELDMDYTVNSDDVVKVPSGSTTVYNSFDNDTYNTNTVYNVELELPDSPNYTDVTPWNEKDVEIENEITVLPPVVVDPDPDGDGDEVIGAVLVKGDPIETPSNFFTLMGSMGAKMHDMYNGVIKFFSDSVDGMEKMLIGSAGLVTFMTGYFDIFPDEFTNVLMVAVMLGFIMHFFRR